uniref:Ovule protein n=1 Tax=Toxocara canis TaxID=6265 RepID=A0A183V4E2_TOXCA
LRAVACAWETDVPSVGGWLFGCQSCTLNEHYPESEALILFKKCDHTIALVSSCWCMLCWNRKAYYLFISSTDFCVSHKLIDYLIGSLFRFC